MSTAETNHLLTENAQALAQYDPMHLVGDDLHQSMGADGMSRLRRRRIQEQVEVAAMAAYAVGDISNATKYRNAFRRLRWAETLEQVQVYVCEPWPAEDLWTGRPSRKTHWHGGETGETGGATGGMEGHEHGRQGDVDTAVSVVS